MMGRKYAMAIGEGAIRGGRKRRNQKRKEGNMLISKELHVSQLVESSLN